MPRRVIPRLEPNYVHHPSDGITDVPALGLQQARLDKGWTLEQLAEASGYSVGTLAGIEASPTELRPRIVTARLSGALGVPTDTIRGIS